MAAMPLPAAEATAGIQVKAQGDVDALRHVWCLLWRAADRAGPVLTSMTR